MKLYIAAHNQDIARDVARLCLAAGHTVTARWIETPFLRTHEYTEPERTQIADDDADDVTAADALVLCASPSRVPGGKFVEAGIALGQRKPVYLLGHRENMLMWHHLVRQFDSAENMLKAIKALT